MPVPFTKRWFQNKKYRDILDKAVTTFDAQYKLLKLAGKSIETKSGINIRALGYLDGFLKSAMKRQQLDIYSGNAYGVFVLLYKTLWGEELGRRYLEYWLEPINEKVDADQSELQKGIELGALDFLYCSQTGKQPMGWLSCFKGESAAPALNCHTNVAHFSLGSAKSSGKEHSTIDFSFMLKHLMGVVGVIIAIWGAGSIYNAIVVPYVSWLQGAFGIACSVGAIVIYLRWFRSTN